MRRSATDSYSPAAVERGRKGVRGGVFPRGNKGRNTVERIKEGVVARRHLPRDQTRAEIFGRPEGSVGEGGYVNGRTRGDDSAGITPGQNSMSFAHPRFVDPLDADVVGERWLLPEY